METLDKKTIKKLMKQIEEIGDKLGEIEGRLDIERDGIRGKQLDSAYGKKVDSDYENVCDAGTAMGGALENLKNI